MPFQSKFVDALCSKLENIPYLPKWFVFGMDLVGVSISFTISYLVCFHLIEAPYLWDAFLMKLLFCLIITGSFFSLWRTHVGIIRYSSFRDALRVFVALVCANITLYGVNILLQKYYGHIIMPGIGFFINFLLSFSFIFFCKMVVRIVFDYVKIKGSGPVKNVPVLIYGVNPMLVELARMVNHSEQIKYRPIGFIAPKNMTAGKRAFNLPVYHINKAFTHKKVISEFKAVVIDPKEIDREQKQRLYGLCLKYKKDLLSVPSMDDWTGNTQFKNLKKVRIEDLLQRVPIEIDTGSIGRNLEGKTVLITGAAGSIGSEIVRQVSHFNIGLLLICDVAESPLHEIRMEINDKYPQINYKILIVNVRDYELMKKVFEKYRPNIIYHAAAYKHVPLMEEHPCEAILTNVLGSKNMADLAMEYKAEAFVMISTDKAVNPSNIMGASKRIAEIYGQSLFRKVKNEKSDTATRFIITRFGNVLGSNGSVIPRFEQQISRGGPITVTHPEIIRYFMTIREACRLVLDAGNFGKGGEVFVFDMGEPVKIKDMAEEMIRLSGFVPYKDIDIIYTGLRPGEKLYEELLYDKETVKPTHNRKIMIGSVREHDYDEVNKAVSQLLAEAAAYHSREVVKLMKTIVPEFKSLNSEYAELDKLPNCH
ncbi:polysaccharide biosynthesis protein CapD [Bacteroidia bacterium]|nr:polysaccharide biosynthesis protein CapD [Bacteroidia bacterium]